MNVPSAVAISVARIATSSEVTSAFARSGSANGCFQWRRVNPCQVKLNRPLLLLKPNNTTMKTGMNRYSSASADQTASPMWRNLSPSGRLSGLAAGAEVGARGASTTAISDRRLGQVLGAEELRVDRDAHQNESHQGERQRGRRRVIQDVQELRLDHVADHVLVRRAEQRGVDEVTARRDEGQQR